MTEAVEHEAWTAWTRPDAPLWAVSDDESGDIIAGGLTEQRAKLIAAAPDLCAALQIFIDAYDLRAVELNSPEMDGDHQNNIPPHPWHEEWLHQARAALTKASAGRKP